MALALCLSGAGLAVAALGRATGKANRSKCHNNLRQIAFGAIQHADDRRVMPHVGPPGELAGGVESNHATRTLRSLVDMGYLESGGFVCPESNDVAVEPVLPTAAGQRWTWGALRGAPHVDATSPDARDPTLAETTELSYGWTRRGLSSNARSTTPLAADRAVRARDADPTDDPLQGNHVGGLGVMQADGSVSWVSDTNPVAARLTAVDDAVDAGALGIWPVGQPRPLRPRPWWGRAGLEGLALVPLGLGGLLLLLRGEPPPRPPRAAPRPRVAALTRLDEASDVQPAQRCPYCHDGVEHEREADVAALTRCSGCSAVFHAECVPQGGACTTLGCPGAAA